MLSSYLDMFPQEPPPSSKRHLCGGVVCVRRYRGNTSSYKENVSKIVTCLL